VAAVRATKLFHSFNIQRNPVTSIHSYLIFGVDSADKTVTHRNNRDVAETSAANTQDWHGCYTVYAWLFDFFPNGGNTF
jgi:hypothetical protein